MPFFLYRFLFYLQFPLLLGFVAVVLFPRTKRLAIVHALMSKLRPLIIGLLFPGWLKDPSSPWQYVEGNNHEGHRLFVIFGGNNDGPSEIFSIVEGLPLPDGSTLHQHSVPRVMVPLLLEDDQDHYRDAILKQLIPYLEQHPEVTELCLVGHSLGGAILMEVLKELLDHYPSYTYLVTLDRCFECLWKVAAYKHGPVLGWLLKHTLGLLWRFETGRTLVEMQDDLRVQCVVHQLIQDDVLGPQTLLSTFIQEQGLEKRYPLVLDDKSVEGSQNGHAMPYLALQQR